MIEFIRVSRPIDIDANDIITLLDASEISGKGIGAIANMLDRGVLPWYELDMSDAPISTRRQRFTSRKAALALRSKG